MKLYERNLAVDLRKKGYAINQIAKEINVAKSSVSLWVRDVKLTKSQIDTLKTMPFTSQAIEKRRKSRLDNERTKRNCHISDAENEITDISNRDLWLMGTMLYWAEGGKTRRMVRFSNGDPEMIRIMIKYFEIICNVPKNKMRGHIHIHEGLDPIAAKLYWSTISTVPVKQFFKTYQKPVISSQNKKHSLPYGVLDIYVLDTALFYKITGWAKGIFKKSKNLIPDRQTKMI